MSRTDEAGGEADPAAPPSRARIARYGWVAWAAGVAVAITQVLLAVLATGGWRTVGVAGLVFVTLAAIGLAAFGRQE